MNQEDKKSVIINFREELEKFTTDVNQLAQNGGLCTEREFLQKIADDVNHLYASCIKVQKAEDEEIEEIGSIIQNIFVQPLAVKRHQRVTILNAVETFNGESESDLFHIMEAYVKHPETTKSFLRELELLTHDLDEALRKTA
ncbi:hypothetical protein [Candidatus Neptunochlamydia vexilliferae]|uniref:Uncharacterized protein n=1 Tax=Candidatus Neptunichlamydia vexilliferae TaxID=1651774 RepID=A0ABS0AZM5_9BACT|nr:hypothetical protein [Candidatus Neptunochlamydia vexilliferae]MBF5059581.1 hypothetical protein [Candidatus Neptunochlamydia vexilliferae]